MLHLLRALLRLRARRSCFRAIPICDMAAQQTPALLAKAAALPVAATYLANGGLRFQPTPFFCGPTTLINVMRSLGDHSVTSHNVFAGAGTHLFHAAKGMPLDWLATFARQKMGHEVTVLRALTLSAFRQHLRHFNALDRRYTINFHRRPLFGFGLGHHSPVGGYLEQEDLVLILDVNKLFRPWLVSPARLYQAMNTLDPDSRQRRGLLLIDLRKRTDAEDAP